MTKRIGTYRRKTRDKLKKSLRTRGKMSLRKFFQTFLVGEEAILKMDPTYQEGNYHHRFHGRHGVVTGNQGKCYFVEISDQGKPKSILVHPVHLKKV